MKRLILLIALVAAACAAWFYPRWFQHAATPAQLKLSGNVQAHESLVSFKVAGRIVALPIEEGQSVTCGELIARLDDDDYRQQVAVDTATVDMRHSQLRLGLAGSRVQDVEAARQAVVDTRADLEQKTKDFARYQALYDKDEVTGQVRDQAQTNVTRAQAAHDRAQQIYGALVEGTRKEEIAIERAAEQQARQAERMSRVRLDYVRLLAPFDGVVLVRLVELGEVVSPGAPVVTLADLAHVWIRAYVPETDLGRVRWGQPVAVRTDTFPGRTYNGRVSFISSDAEFTPKTVQTEKERVTLVYRIKIDVDNPRFELKPGMPADAVLDTSGRN
jgi:HlyD family secretion protein